MNGKTALVTGGMGGIGTAICQHLAKQGSKVVACYNRDPRAARTWLEEQRAEGYEFAISYVDITDFQSCANLVQDIITKFGRIDILVNNAGITQDIQLYKMDPEQWQNVLRTNLDGIFNVTRNVINWMIEHGYGRIINISSINGQKGQFGQTNYSASKAGIHGFTKALAQEVARKGITVNTVSPGYIETKMVMSVSEEIREKIIAQIPVGRLGKPEEIANAIGFLASQTSGFITGSNLVINGGQYLI